MDMYLMTIYACFITIPLSIILAIHGFAVKGGRKWALRETTMVVMVILKIINIPICAFALFMGFFGHSSNGYSFLNGAYNNFRYDYDIEDKFLII